jgi:hypothetical protein
MSKICFLGGLAVAGWLAMNSAAFGFWGDNPTNDVDEQLVQLFDNNIAFTATALVLGRGERMQERLLYHSFLTAVVTGKGGLGAGSFSVEMECAFSNGKFWTSVDISQVKTRVNRAGIEQMMEMGLRRINKLIRPDKKMNYVIYPGLNGYCAFPQTVAGQSTNAPPKIEKTELGKETIDGHPCVKSKIVMTLADKQKYESVVWRATDLTDFPIKCELASGEDSVITLFRNIRMQAPPASRFEIPDGVKRYPGVPEMMAGNLQIMMQRAKSK